MLFSPYALGLAGRMSDTAAVATGVGVWLATVVLADLMRRAGVRGPAEAALRRLTYGRPARETAPSPDDPVRPPLRSPARRPTLRR